MAIGIPVTSFSVDIAAGNSLSAGIGVGQYLISGIIFPAVWTAASLSFQISDDDVNWYDLYDGTGEYVLSTAGTSRFVAVESAKFIGVKAIKLRSGAAGTPVVQVATRSLKIIGRDVA